MTINDEDYQSEHAAMLGRVSLAWNDCHMAGFTIFYDLSGIDVTSKSKNELVSVIRSTRGYGPHSTIWPVATSP
jgi:hypothetical protein